MNIKVSSSFSNNILQHSLKYFPTAIIKTASSAVMTLQCIIPLNMCFKNKPASTNKFTCVSGCGGARIKEWQQDHKQIKGFFFGLSTYPSLTVPRESDIVQ